MNLPDFSHLSAVQFGVILVAVGLFDFVTGLVGAIGISHTFRLDLLLRVLYTHGVQRVLPLAVLFAVGQEAASAPLILLADLGLAGYVAETVGSAVTNLNPGSRPGQ